MSKKRLLYYIYVLILFASCEKDQDAMLTQLEVMKEQFTPSYTSIAVECQLNTSASIKDVYVQYATSQDFADYQEEEMQKKDEKYTTNLSNLEENTTYFIRYVASNQYSTGTTKDISTATTLTQSPPTIKLISVNDILNESATAKFEVQHDGGASITQTGICWSMNRNPTIDNTHVESKNQQTTIPISNLQANTTYYLRAYAVNRKGIGYSEQEISFTTLTLPVVQTNEITDIQLTTALLNGNLIFNGNDTATILGFCWGETPQPTISNNQKQVATNSNNFAYQLSNLKDETKYYVRAYAKNKIGVSYGEEKSFTTTSAIKPTLTTSSPTNISYTSATVGGNVTSDGGAAVTERGVVYSTNQNPTTSDSNVTSGSGTGSFTCDLTNLQENTKYYVRAYATNKKGTSYGPQSSFTTQAYALPTLTTSSATNISYTSATIGGNVTNDGGTSVTERGVVYSTTQNPTTSNTKVPSGNGKGSFSCLLSNLQDGTNYYVRAYAINKKGTSYGEQKSFTTKESTLPSVTTSATSNISYTSATVGGNVTSDGGANITERGVVYSTTQNPTTSNTKVPSGNGKGSFSCLLSNLQDGTNYYVRAYAINKKGTSYGEQKSFTTTAYVLPTVTTSSATNLSQTSATIGGNVTSDGGANVTERGVVYSTSQNPTTSNSKVICGSGEGDFSCTLTSLNRGTTYYVCAYAVNCKGTSYGNQIRFTTFTTHSYVDLGLSVKWATCNIGAETPEEYGEFFAWGEVEPKENYSWITYKWCNTTGSTLTKYNTKSSYGIVDNKTQLDISDDAASANWGGDWRMPTAAEWEELRRECTWTWSNNGYKVTSDINGKSIFLPAAGSMNESTHSNQSEYGWYRSSSLDTYDPRYNNGMVFMYLTGYGGSGSSMRYRGCSVRPVHP